MAKCRYCDNERLNNGFYCQSCLDKIRECDKCDPKGTENWHRGKCLECSENPIKAVLHEQSNLPIPSQL